MTTTITPTAAEQQIIDLMEQGFTTAFALVKQTGKTPAAIRSILNRMRHRGLIEGSLQMPALIAPRAAAAPKPACPAPIITVKHQNNEWLVAVEGAAFSGRIAKTRAAALEAAVEECMLRNLGHFTLVNKLGRTVSYTVTGGKAKKGAVA